MSAIKQALNRLDSSIRKLEGSMTGLERQLAGKQRDMFSAATPAGKGNGAGKAAQAAANDMLTQRLDQAIHKVENILKESTN